MIDDQPDPGHTTRLRTEEIWPDFAAPVEANNGVWGGCWCRGFHPEGVASGIAGDHRDAREAHVSRGTVHQVLVYDGGACVGWCRFGPPVELPRIKNPKAYGAGVTALPDWRIGWLSTGRGHRGRGWPGPRSPVR